MTTNVKAQAAFIKHAEEARAMLAVLTAYVNNHANIDPASVHWGHVGDMEEMANKIKAIAERFSI